MDSIGMRMWESKYGALLNCGIAIADFGLNFPTPQSEITNPKYEEILA